MADEAAFLASMAAGEYDQSYPAQQSAYGDQEDDEDDDYDPSSLLPDTDDQPAPTESGTASRSLSKSPVATAKPPPNAAAAMEPARSVTATPVGQPRTKGGFVIDDEDDEDETPVTSLAQATGSYGQLEVANGGSATPPQRSVSQTPINTNPSTSADVFSRATDDQGASAPAVVSTSGSDSVPHASPALTNGAAAQVSQTVPAASTVSPTSVARANITQPAAAETPITPSSSAPKRLANDRVGILEDRIAECPRGDLDAWLDLISEHRRRNKLGEARAVWDRFFEVFPTAAEQWKAYAEFELHNDELSRLERIFSNSLRTNAHVPLWSMYLAYIRRRNNLTTDMDGSLRQIVSQVFDFVLDNVGIDKDSEEIWREFIDFVKSGPGNLGGNSWQDQQKVDIVRKAYTRAIAVPTRGVEKFWKEYDQFELGLNKATGRKHLQEKSPIYMTARTAKTALNNITQGLDRTTLARLPPSPGFEGDVEYMQQVDIWKRWIAWEKEDPLVFKDDEPESYKSRVFYTYKQALMALRFWPEMWYDAAEFCFQNGLDDEGEKFLADGAAANPESCLLAFKRADRIEQKTAADEGDQERRGKAVREPYDKVLDALYTLIKKSQEREKTDVARMEELLAQQADTPDEEKDDGYDDDQAENGAINTKEATHKARIEALKKGHEVQIRLLKKTISYAWIALMRAMRRIQGKGKPGTALGGARQIFAEARKRGQITSDVYIASAQIEWRCYQEPAATKIFEKGMKLFPEDEMFALEYLKHLIEINDVTNARATFETTVNRLIQKPGLIPKAKPLFSFYYEYECQFGELSQISTLEKRMAEHFADDPQLSFSRRFTVNNFDPTAIRPIISPAVQARPKASFLLPLPTVEKPPSITGSPRPAPPPQLQVQGPGVNSPKRPLPSGFDESDTESVKARKLNRGESPLKGAAGRRLDAKRAQQQRHQQHDGYGTPQHQHVAPPAAFVLPTQVRFLLSILPPAHTYHATLFNPQAVSELLRNTDLARANLHGGHGQPAPPPSVRPPPMQHAVPPQTPMAWPNQGYGGYPPQYGR